MPIRTIASGTPATGVTPRRFEFDLAGTGGSLADGTLSVGGYDWNLDGIGATSTLLNFYIRPTELYVDYDGSKHSVEIVADVVRNAWSQNYAACVIGRKDAATSGAQPGGAVGFFQTAAFYTLTSSTSLYMGCGSKYDGTETASYTNIANSTLDPTRMSTICAGSACLATFRETTTGSAVRWNEDASAANYSWAVRDAAFGTSTPWSTTDVINFSLLVFSGSAKTTTATQDAAGLTLTLGTGSVTLKKLYVYLGTPEIP